MTPEAKQLLKDKPELCKEIFIAAWNRWDSMPGEYKVEDHETAFDDLVKEHTAKDWEILSFKDQHGDMLVKRHHGKYTFENGAGFLSAEDILNDKIEGVCSGKTSIHSVRRLSDNEVFTVGEWTGWLTSYSAKITGFEICQGEELNVKIDATPWSLQINNLTKFTPLFITEDEKSVFEGDEVTPVDINTFIIKETAGYYTGSCEHYKYFSTREAAEQWVEDHKPRYSIADLKARGLHI